MSNTRGWEVGFLLFVGLACVWGSLKSRQASESVVGTPVASIEVE